MFQRRPIPFRVSNGSSYLSQDLPKLYEMDMAWWVDKPNCGNEKGSWCWYGWSRAWFVISSKNLFSKRMCMTICVLTKKSPFIQGAQTSHGWLRWWDCSPLRLEMDGKIKSLMNCLSCWKKCSQKVTHSLIIILRLRRYCVWWTLSIRKIHACLNDSILYWNELETLKNCHRCGITLQSEGQWF